MRKLLITICLLLVCSNSWAEIAFVQSKSANGATSVTFDSQPTQNNLIVFSVFVYGDYPGESDASDNQGNTYTRVIVNNSSTDCSGSGIGIYWAQASTVGTPFTVSIANVSGSSIAIHEYSGVDTADMFDQAAYESTDERESATAECGTITPSNGNSLIYAATTHESSVQTITAGSGYTIRETITAVDNAPVGTEDKLLVTPASTSPTFTIGASCCSVCGMAVFNPAVTASTRRLIF